MPLIQRRILNIRPNRCDNLVAHIGLVFNMCYHDLVNLLSESTGGICNNSINGFSYYVFCHAIWYSLHYNYSQIVIRDHIFSRMQIRSNNQSIESHVLMTSLATID